MDHLVSAISEHYAVRSTYSTPTEALKGRTGPKDRPLMALNDQTFTSLEWDAIPQRRSHLQLVLTTVVEPPGGGTNKVLVYSGDAEQPAAAFDLICSDPYEIHAIPLPAACIPDSGPLVLRLKVENPGLLWFFAPDSSASGGLEFHVPHLVDTSSGKGDYLARLVSMASIQTFSWKEGCVLDAIHTLSERGMCPAGSAMIRKHLNYFGFEPGNLVYETPRSSRVSNELDTIETTLPFAHVALLDLNHPWVDLAVSFWSQLIAAHGQAREPHMISSEGAYTVAYPMTLIARLRGEPKWFGVAESLLVETFQSLVRPDGVYLRDFNGEKQTHRNWARGLCWLLLGHVQTLRQQPEPSAKILEQLEYLAAFAKGHQSEAGLWHCFVDEPEVLPDTSGSAGIAAAFALAAREGYLPQEYFQRAQLTHEALQTYLTPDGFLSGCSQSNKGGEELQRSPHRVTLPYALGLLGLLDAATAGS